MMRLILAMIICALCGQLSLAQEAKLATRPMQDENRLRSVSTRSAEEYAGTVMQMLPYISRDYHFEKLSEEALAGRALLGLYRAGSITPPEALSRDADHYFERAPGDTLLNKLKKARETVGEMPLIQGARGIHASMKAVFQTLDPFSNYSEVDYNTRRVYEAGAGIGLHLEDKPLGGSYFIRNIDIEGAAHKQGLRPGDEILEVDSLPISPNTPTAGVNAQITVSARRAGGVSLTIRNLQGEKKVIKVNSRRTGLDNGEMIAMAMDVERETPMFGYRPTGEREWNYWVDRPNRIAIIRLGIIQEPPSRFIEVVNQLLDDGLKGLILDLRDCPSGVPEYTADLAGHFLEHNALITSMNYRNPNNNDMPNAGKKELRARQADSKRCLDLPLVVLIGPDTSGAAEMIAAALQDHERARIIGQRSRGKSTIQKAPPEQGNAYRIFYSYRLTVGVFLRPSGKNLHRMPGATVNEDWGVRPDVEVVLPAQMRRQVRAWWFDHDIRPADSLEPTKIDDPRNDPVLLAGLKVLRKE